MKGSRARVPDTERHPTREKGGKIPSILFLVLIIGVGFVICPGCTSHNPSPAEMDGSPGPGITAPPAVPQTGSPIIEEKGYTLRKDVLPGVSLSAPASWDVTSSAIGGTTGIIISDGGSTRMTISPVQKDTARPPMDARTALAYGLAAVALDPQVTVESASVSRDGTLGKAVASYTANGKKMRYGVFVEMKDGAGIMASYSASADAFSSKETVLGKILGSFTYAPANMASPKAEPLPVTPVSPQIIFDNPQYTDFPGGIIVSIPRGWDAYQKQSDTCSITWWAGDPGMNSQVFSESSVIMYRDAQSKAKMVDYWTNLYHTYGTDSYKLNLDIWSAVPVNDNPTPESFVTQMLPYIGQSQAYQEVYPNLAGIADVRIDRTWPATGGSEVLSGLTPKTAGYDISFTKNGKPMKGAVFVVTFDGTPTWSGYISGIFAPSTEYGAISPTLAKIYYSTTVTDAWRQYCRDVTAYSDKIRDEIRKNRQISESTASENFAAYIRDYGYYKDQDGRVVKMYDEFFRGIDQPSETLGLVPLPFEEMKQLI